MQADVRERRPVRGASNARRLPNGRGFLMKTLFVVAAILGFAFWFGGYHIVLKPTDAQLFGCSRNYINAKGEDTGECP
jgi:hypothetical protein